MNEANERADGGVVVGEGKHVRLVRRKGWEFAERVGELSGIVVVVSVTGDGRAVLVSQWREPVQAMVVEWPAGLAGDVPGAEGESLAEAAKRELFEETGFVARSMEKLWVGPPSAGISSEVVTFFHGAGLARRGEGGGVGNEKIRVHLVPLAGAEGWMAAREKEGWLVDPKVWAGLYWLRNEVEEMSYA